MSYCAICGDETRLSPVRRYWSPDDGWRLGRFCRSCRTLAAAKPHPEDFAYAKRSDYVSDLDEAINHLYG